MRKSTNIKRKDGRYCKQKVIGRDENGKRIVKSFYDTNWTRLEKSVAQYEGSGHLGLVEQKYTIEDCYNSWIATKYSLADSTIRNYQSAFKQLGNLRYKLINECRPMDIQTLYAELRKKKNPWVIEGIHIVLKQVFEFAKNNDIISKNIINVIEAPKKVRGKRRGLTDEERQAFYLALSKMNTWQQNFVMVCMLTGMRRNEILALTKRDIDFTNGVIHVNKMVAYKDNGEPYIKNSLKTEAGFRNIPLFTELQEYIEPYVQSLPDKDSFLFVTKTGTLISNGNFESRWRTILKRVNQFLPDDKATSVTPHYFRHDFATNLFYAGVDLKAVQYIMGHTSLNITMNIYTDLRINIQDINSRFSDYQKNRSVKSQSKLPEMENSTSKISHG